MRLFQLHIHPVGTTGGPQVRAAVRVAILHGPRERRQPTDRERSGGQVGGFRGEGVVGRHHILRHLAGNRDIYTLDRLDNRIGELADGLLHPGCSPLRLDHPLRDHVRGYARGAEMDQRGGEG